MFNLVDLTVGSGTFYYKKRQIIEKYVGKQKGLSP
jgi:hypothetical protein